MFLLKRLSPFLIVISNFAIFEAIIKWPHLFFTLLGLVLILNLFFVVLLTKNILDFKVASRFWLTYFLFTISVGVSFLFLNNDIWRQTLILISIFLIATFQEFLFRFLYYPEKYKAYSLENLNNLMNLLTFFMANLAIFALMVFLNMVLWLGLLVEFIFIVCLFILLFRANKLDFDENKWTVISAGILLLEFFAIFSWLPFNFFIRAVLMSSLYYLLVGSIKLIATNQMTKNKLLVFFGVTIFIWAISFVSSRWI